jgi:hypothetical protein
VFVCGVNTYEDISLNPTILTSGYASVNARNIPPGYVCSYKLSATDTFFKSGIDHTQFRSDRITHIDLQNEKLPEGVEAAPGLDDLQVHLIQSSM